MLAPRMRSRVSSSAILILVRSAIKRPFDGHGGISPAVATTTGLERLNVAMARLLPAHTHPGPARGAPVARATGGKGIGSAALSAEPVRTAKPGDRPPPLRS